MESLADILKRVRLASSTGVADVPDPRADACPQCGGYGWVTPVLPVEHPDFGHAVPCACRAAQYEQRLAQRLQRYSHIPAPLLDAMTFASWNPDGNGATPEQCRALASAYNEAMDYANNPDGHWLLLLGDVGSGKTHLAVAVAATRPLSDVFFASVPVLLGHLRRAYTPSSDITYDDLFDRAKHAPLLIVDDLGAESAPTPWARETLLQLIVHRHDSRLSTVVTSRSLTGMPAAMVSRLRDRRFVITIQFSAPDYRLARGESE